MVTYTCDICSKQFNRKSNYDYHIGNKKKPCQQITDKINQNLPNLPKLTKKYDLIHIYVCIPYY